MRDCFVIVQSLFVVSGFSFLRNYLFYHIILTEGISSVKEATIN